MECASFVIWRCGMLRQIGQNLEQATQMYVPLVSWTNQISTQCDTTLKLTKSAHSFIYEHVFRPRVFTWGERLTWRSCGQSQLSVVFTSDTRYIRTKTAHSLSMGGTSGKHSLPPGNLTCKFCQNFSLMFKQGALKIVAEIIFFLPDFVSLLPFVQKQEEENKPT